MFSISTTVKKLGRKLFAKNEEGATAIEYGLIAALIAVAAIVAMGKLGSGINKTFSNVAATMGVTK